MFSNHLQVQCSLSLCQYIFVLTVVQPSVPCISKSVGLQRDAVESGGETGGSRLDASTDGRLPQPAGVRTMGSQGHHCGVLQKSDCHECV
jgi:hypothetical protein